MHRVPQAFCVALSCVAARHADAAPSTRDCVAAHTEGQILRHDGHLLEATAQFNLCAVESCPAIVRSDCTELRHEVDTAQPTVIFTVIDGQGKERTDARIAVDDASPVPLSTEPLALDPGEHVLSFTLPNGSTRSLHVVLREWDKARRIVAELPAPPPTTASKPPYSPSPAVYVLGGLGVAGLASFAYFGLSGLSLQHDLEECAPHCAKADVDRMRSRYLIADVSLLVAVTSLGVGTYLFLSGRPAPESKESARLELRLSAGRGGASISAVKGF